MSKNKIKSDFFFFMCMWRKFTLFYILKTNLKYETGKNTKL